MSTYPQIRAKRKATLPNNVDTETLVMSHFLRDGRDREGWHAAVQGVTGSQTRLGGWITTNSCFTMLCCFFFLINFILFLNFTILYWFCQISKWIRHRYTCVPHPEPSSLLPPHISCTYTYIPSFLDFFPIWVITEHWVELPRLYSRFSC